MRKLKNSAMLMVAVLCGYLALMTPDWKSQLLAVTSQAYISDFNADGTDDLLLTNRATGENRAWILSNHARSVNNALPARDPDADVLALIDTDGDFDEDVFWYNPNSGVISVWEMNAGTYVAKHVVGNVDSATPVESGDFDGDGDLDLLRISASGNVKVWLLQNMALQSSHSLGIPDGTQQVVDVGDVDGSGTDDIILINGNGTVRAWLLDSSAQIIQTTNLGTVPAGFGLKRTGDVDNDGDHDLIFRNDSTGVTRFWIVDNGLTSTVNTQSPENSGKRLAMVADFDQDGDKDLLFRSPTNGSTDLWEIENGNRVATYPIGESDAKFQLQSIADTDGDGDYDLVFQRPDTGQVQIWIMNGTAYQGKTSPATTPSAQWEVRF